MINDTPGLTRCGLYLHMHSPTLSTQQLDFFHREGYLSLPRAIAPPLLKKLQDLFTTLMQEPGIIDKTVAEHNGTTYVTSLEKLCSKGDLSCLQLLGSPFLLQIAEAICGSDFFLIQEFAVIKHLGDSTPVLWHQDMVHERTGHSFTMGIYLDDANAGDGALRVIPQSHTSGKDICALQKEAFIEVPMKTGDILLHDMMLAHSSGIMHHNRQRRVLYFEFLSLAQVRRENIYTEDLLQNRMQLLHLAIHHYRQQYPNEAFFAWENPLGISANSGKTTAVALQEIYAREVNARPSAYCFEFS
jgi:ectoine hydroxylase-related dioxygenase (phytanoyl-CoA dioxygenase family)